MVTSIVNFVNKWYFGFNPLMFGVDHNGSRHSYFPIESYLGRPLTLCTLFTSPCSYGCARLSYIYAIADAVCIRNIRLCVSCH